MKILVSHIDPNPHRDLERNPISEEQVAKIIDSMKQTGFWDNVVVRSHPEAAGRYQLAYGHNRLEACRRMGITEVDLPTRELSDYQMLCAMISENLTQQGILPPRVVFESIVAALRLAERLLSSTNTVEEFNNLLKFETRSGLNESPKWSTIQYGQAKSALSETGNGLGKDFVKRIMPKDTCPSDETLQNTIDSFYRERRQVAAERRALAAEEARRAALAEKEALEEQAKLASAQEEAAKREGEEAERKERDAADLAATAKDEKTKQAALRMIGKHRTLRKKAVRIAGRAADEKTRLEKDIEQTQQKIAEETKRAVSERARAEKYAQTVIRQDLLERLGSASKMNDVIRLVKELKIPQEHHEELIKAANSWWAPDSPYSQEARTSILIRGKLWWDFRSGASTRRWEKLKKEKKWQKLRDTYGWHSLSAGISTLISKIVDSMYKAKEPFNILKLAAEHLSTLQTGDLKNFLERFLDLKERHVARISELDIIIMDIKNLLSSREREVNPFHDPLQIELQRDAVLAEMDEPMDGHILSIDEAGATASPSPRV